MAQAFNDGPGVGAKAALAIMGALGADGLNESISIGDWAAASKQKV